MRGKNGYDKLLLLRLKKKKESYVSLDTDKLLLICFSLHRKRTDIIC
jgi:hypothetical protein